VTTPDSFDPLALRGSFAYLESDVPPGVTLPAWRHHRASTPAPNAEAADGAGPAQNGRAPRALRWARRKRP
jgi:hypothetical protein